GRADVEAVDVDRRMDDRRVPAPELRDPLLRDLRVGDEVVDPSRRVHVPLPDPIELLGEQRSHDRRNLADRAVALVPDVAERTVAVADVGPLRPRADSVCERARARDDHLVVAELETVDRAREQRQEIAEALLPDGQTLEYRRPDLSVREVSVD